MRTTAALLALTLASPLFAELPEASKALTLEGAAGAALDAAPRPPAPVRAPAPLLEARVRSYALGGFTFEADARNALQAAQANLAAAGLKTLRAAGTRQRGGSWSYGFRVEYFEANEPSAPAREVLELGDGNFAWDSDARAALEARESDLRARGYAIVNGLSLKRSQWPYRYYYRIGYAANGAPASSELYTSGLYRRYDQARLGLEVSESDFARKGYQVWSGRLYRAGGDYFYQLRYRPRR